MSLLLTGVFWRGIGKNQDGTYWHFECPNGFLTRALSERPRCQPPGLAYRANRGRARRILYAHTEGYPDTNFGGSRRPLG